MAKKTEYHAHARTFEIVQYVTGYIEGVETMDDLPRNLQDRIYAALEDKAMEVQLPLKIIAVRCDKDLDSEDPQRQFFLHVVASEVIALVLPGRSH